MSRIKNLIQSHGGTTAVARGCKIKAQTVSNWIMRESIPIRHWNQLLEMGFSREDLVDAHLKSDNKKAVAKAVAVA